MHNKTQNKNKHQPLHVTLSLCNPFGILIGIFQEKVGKYRSGWCIVSLITITPAAMTLTARDSLVRVCEREGFRGYDSSWYRQKSAKIYSLFLNIYSTSQKDTHYPSLQHNIPYVTILIGHFRLIYGVVYRVDIFRIVPRCQIYIQYRLIPVLYALGILYQISCRLLLSPRNTETVILCTGRRFQGACLDTGSYHDIYQATSID